MRSDEQLMADASRGDMDAFESLVRRHQRSALSTARRFLADEAQAEDVVQEAFLKVLAGARRYRPAATFRTYLCNVVWRLCVDAYRRKKPLRLADTPLPAQRSLDPQADALRREVSRTVQDEVAKLPHRQRMALVLKHFEGMSYDEIAQALDCTPRAVDSLLIRARRTLKDNLRGIM
jgi:RNA polymerase sigma-70 factor (ECF subfamily)